MSRLKLPIGIQSFSSLREGGYTYVDKTAFIANLVNTGKVLPVREICIVFDPVMRNIGGWEAGE